MNEESLFIEALLKPTPEARAAFLDAACADDAALRRAVELLLRAHERAGPFLRDPAAAAASTVDAPTREGPGTVVGPYRLLEQIGEGGFGVVFMAEQVAPVRRKVALKVLKPGMDSKQVVARFEAERQALALMDHPHIAHVFDGGETPTGRPYFVMELVKGVPITDFCDQNCLGVRARLGLFVDVCQAVQHAHQKGVIHRDLKPSNVLVTLHDGTPVVKVIDFGIAKATGQQLTEKTLFTNFAQLIGTPLYMSPEQAALSGLDVDTRSDIYSLGVLLYELLTGTTPFDKERFRSAGYDEMRRIIQEEEPPRPSTRLSTLGQAATTLSTQRKSDPTRLRQLLRGELDWIVMKALEKDRNHRYETANSLARDVERYLRDEPVLACPPSLPYRFRKFARRNKVVLMTAAFVAVALVLGTVVSAWQALRATQAEHLAQKRLEILETNLYFHRIALAEREWSANNLARVEELLEQCPPALRGWEWHYLKRLRLERLPPLSHSSFVLSAAFSPDGRWIASGGQDGMITVWDAATGREAFKYRAHPNHARSLAFSPDGRRLASASWDKTVKVWDLSPRPAGGIDHPRFTLEGHQAEVNQVVFSPDGWRLASAGDDGAVRVWDAETGEAVLTLRGHAQLVGGVAFSPDGQSLASAGSDATVRLWDARTGQERLTLRGHRAPVSCVAFSRDGKWLASGTADSDRRAHEEVKVWDAETGQEVWTLRGHVGWIYGLAFSADGRRLASGGFDANVKVWDLATGREALTLRGHRSVIRSVAFSPDGHRLLSAGHDRTVRLWDATPVPGDVRQERLTLHGHPAGVRSVTFSPDGRRLASAGDDATVRLWDVQRGLGGLADPLVRSLPAHTGFALNVAFSGDGRRLASGSYGGHKVGQVKVWDAASGRELFTVPRAGAPVAFSPDGQYLAAVGKGFRVEILEAATGQPVRSLRGHSWAILTTAFSPAPDAAYLASASADGSVRLWDVATGQQITSFRHPDGALALDFSRDGRLLVSGGHDGTVKVWEVQTGRVLHEFADPTGRVQGVAFHPRDGSVVAWGSTDGAVKVGSTETGKVHTLHGHASCVQAVAFSPDGNWIASASLDGTVKLWRVPLPAESPGPPGM
jgi:WD40 repeat protein/serine/threonine protein kinase